MSSPSDLKNAGLKATVPRLKIINLFEASKVRHLTAEDVYRKLLSEGLDIGLATVYRVLTQFEQAGLLVRHHFESGKAVFELNEGHHHDHIVCLQCGRVEEFYDAEIEKRQSEVARERGFEITEHALYLYAECVKPRCPHRGRRRRVDASASAPRAGAGYYGPSSAAGTASALTSRRLKSAGRNPSSHSAPK